MRALLLFLPLALSACGDAKEGPTPPLPELAFTARVVDNANIFDADFERGLNAKLAALEQDTKVQFVVVSTPDLKGHPIDDYSLRLANNWGIGSKERNDGLMLLVAPNEGRARIEVGLGLEKAVTDEEAKQIMNSFLIPNFKKQDYETGAMQGVEQLILEVTSNELKPNEFKEAA